MQKSFTVLDMLSVVALLRVLLCNYETIYLDLLTSCTTVPHYTTFSLHGSVKVRDVYVEANGIASIHQQMSPKVGQAHADMLSSTRIVKRGFIHPPESATSCGCVLDHISNRYKDETLVDASLLYLRKCRLVLQAPLYPTSAT